MYLCCNLTYIPSSISLVGTCFIILQFDFYVLRSLNAVFHSDYISLYSHQQCMKVPFSLHPCKYLLILFLMIAIPTAVR
jgi:hypothetical protein